MDQEDALQSLNKQGWLLDDAPHLYMCGFCGASTSTSICLVTEHVFEHTFDMRSHERPRVHVRVCTNCRFATTFIQKECYPGEPLGKPFDVRAKPDDVQLVVELYDEARAALRENATSCAVLMFRKLLMHIAVEQGADEGKRFVQYVAHLKDEGTVGKPQHGILDRIKDAGNLENHEIRRATPAEAIDLLNLATHLIEGLYFMP